MDSSFKTFLEKIKLTDLQKEDAKTKIKSVCEKLHSKYYPNQSYDGSTKLLIGSYGKHTHIRPPKDIDVIFRMPDEEFDRYNSLSGNKQSQLLQDIREVLKEKFVTTEKISAWGKVIVISFSEGSHTVELLPAWQTEAKTFRIPDTENGGSWHIWDPLAEIKHVKDSSVETDRTKSLIRMLKSWIRNCNVPIKSYVLEILVVEYLKQKFNNQVNILYPELMLGFFEFLKTKRNSSVFSIGYNTFVSLGEEWFSKTESAYNRAEKAIEYESSDQMRDASLEWQKIFGGDFLIAQDKIFVDTLETKILQLSQAYPSSDEEFITDRGIQIKRDMQHTLSIDALVTPNGFRAGWLGDFLAHPLSSFILFKGKSLEFKIRETNVPTPYSVFWKVRNFGEDAQRAGGLRGEITPDYGRHAKTESTLYHGEHYVECYIVKDSVCVAVGRILVPIGANYE